MFIQPCSDVAQTTAAAAAVPPPFREVFLTELGNSGCNRTAATLLLLLLLLAALAPLNAFMAKNACSRTERKTRTADIRPKRDNSSAHNRVLNGVRGATSVNVDHGD